MTKEQMSDTLSGINQIYPSFLKDRDPEAVLGLWHSFFQDEDSRLVQQAVHAFMYRDNKGFPPTPGQIVSLVNMSKRKPDELTDMKAWSMVYKALTRSIYNSKEEFDKLPKVIQSVVGSPEQLKSWAMLDEQEVQTVVSSNFQRSYNARKKHIEEYEQLPASFRQLLESADIGHAGYLAQETTFESLQSIIANKITEIGAGAASEETEVVDGSSGAQSAGTQGQIGDVQQPS